MITEKYVIDVTFEKDKQMVGFMPIDSEGRVVLGLTIMQSRCPGELIGIFHADGEEAAQKWLDENPDAFEKYRKLEAE